MKIGWIVVGGPCSPSARIMGYNVNTAMQDIGLDSQILSYPDEYSPWLNLNPNDMEKLASTDCDVVIFQKVCMAGAVPLAIKLRERGKKVVFIIDDLIVREALEMMNVVDIIVAGSEFLKAQLPPIVQGKTRVIHDAYETDPEKHKLDYSGNYPLSVVWFGTLGHFPQAEELRPVVESLGFDYITITASDQATSIWNLETVFDQIQSADIVVVPYLGELPDYEKAKGTNKAVQSMVLGIPVVASPIPSYLELIRNGYNGYIALNNDRTDFALYLKLLKSQELRERIGKAGRESVVSAFHISTVVKRWEEILNEKGE